MRVAVEEPVPEDHRHPRLAHPVREAPPLVERVRQCVDVGDLRPFEELERQHARTRVAPVDVRDCDMRVAGPVAAEAVGVPPFRAVVELRADRAGELVDERARVDEVERANAFLRDARRLVEKREVGLDLPRRARPLHLHCDALAVRKRRAVHLPDRRGCDRRRVEGAERALERQAELGLDDLLDLLERERPHVVLQRAKLGDDVRRHDVGPRRENLAELHERRPELVEHLAQVHAALVGGDRHGRSALPERQQVGQLVLLDEVAEPVADCDLRDLRQAPEVALLRPRRHGVSVARREEKPC